MIFEPQERLSYLINESWQILFQRIVSGKQLINKEASLQLQLARILNDLGNAYCILPNETFQLELETGHNGKNIDITCHLGEVKAAIELKCFMKSSNRAKDLDMYDALIDIERLESFEEFDIKKFFCLTDNKYYSETVQKGMASSVTLRNGTIYKVNEEIVPLWTGKWKVKRDKPIIFKKDVVCNWVSNNGWYYLLIE
ncbi:hypothetical protein K5V07_06095 [Flavobacterium sp. CHNK8]|uniref:hypothetical protein n=1 Tax=Flavobacterium sp. CHNK8 TaxID=2871165 RepID=UPI001C8D1463|nr:hypothetical protein [Flavobacterium sp. CHNK8]QZK90083.1 hypothetical protein K5V07_06095 [Flavobacterium sp. CHNK8]